jgi:hypothetical protein
MRERVLRVATRVGLFDFFLLTAFTLLAAFTDPFLALLLEAVLFFTGAFATVLTGVFFCELTAVRRCTCERAFFLAGAAKLKLWTNANVTRSVITRVIKRFARGSATATAGKDKSRENSDVIAEQPQYPKFAVYGQE